MNLDDQLLLGFQKGEKQAFEAIFNRFKGPIMSFVMGMVRNQSLAEDLTQEVFFKAFRAHERYEKKAKFSTWLWSIARNTCIDHYRKTKNEGQLNLSNFGEDDSSRQFIEETVEAPLSNPESELLNRSEIKDVEDCLGRMKTQYREALMLRLFEESSYEEMSQKLDVTVSLVKTHLFRARKMLLDCLNLKASQAEGGSA